MTALASLAGNLQRLREARGWTISGLAQRCGIAKSTLSLLESGQGNPTIETLWAIANALDAPFGALLSGKDTGGAGLGDEKTNVRLIERTQSANGASIETYSMSIEPGHTRESAPHPAGVREKVVVTCGAMLAGDVRAPKLVNAGEVYAFAADMPHVYGALNESAQAMVFVEYPAASHGGSALSTVLDWPESAAGWDGVRSIVDRMCVEAANGVVVRMLRFRACAQPAAAALKRLRDELADAQGSGFRWPVLRIAEVDHDGVFLAVLPQRFAHAFHDTKEEPCGEPRFKQAVRLARAAESGLHACDALLWEDAQVRNSWTLETLACECALHEGQVRLPSPIRQVIRRAHAVARSGEDGAFSSRIQVAHYDAFELLHPAYARQVVAMAQDIVAFVPDAQRMPLHTVDVGTGPGVPLRMLKELLPGMQVLAVEPDPVAYACLEDNVKGLTGITLHQGGFLELDHLDGQTALITSVGASHHFQTAFMLQKAMRLLQPGGVLSVADEFLPLFHDIESRNRALVCHHASYILAAACLLEHSGQAIAEDAEGALYRAFRSNLVQAILHAQQGQTLQAVRMCRALYTLARQTDLDKNCAHVAGAYTRFFWLELQAMVAGFDYEVERKTHLRRFLELAAATGFELLRQRRVFATHGWQEQDGGTHVIALRKPIS